MKTPAHRGGVSLNQAVLGIPFLVYSTGYFYRLCLLAVPAILIGVYLRRPAHYRYLRTVLVITTLLDLPLVWLFPALTAFVVIATGHHYVLDVAAGVVLVAAAIRVTRWIVPAQSARSLPA